MERKKERASGLPGCDRNPVAKKEVFLARMKLTLPSPSRRSLLLACQRFRGNKTPERTFTTGCF